MEQKKKLSKAQIEKRLANAVVLIEKTKDTRDIFFSDKGVRLTITDDYAIIGTNYHRHIFDKITVNGESRPYIYTEAVVDLALANLEAITDEQGGYSFNKLIALLREDTENTAPYNIVTFYSWWLFVIFNNLYTIGEREIDAFTVYFNYMAGISANMVFLEERKEDLTAKGFVKDFTSKLQSLMEDVSDFVLLPHLSDEERAAQEAKAIDELENEALLNNE